MDTSSVSDIINGHWSNQLGSYVTFECKNDNNIIGSFRTAVVSNKDDLVINELPPPTPLSGSYQATPDGILISFIVH